MAFGLPAISGISARASTVGVLAQLENFAWKFLELPLTWKILNVDNDEVAFEADNFIEFNLRSNADVVNVPISEGSFASYNKVDRPKEIRISIAVWGLANTRLRFLSWLEKAKRDTIKVRILTPETVYGPVTLANYNVSRTVVNGTVTRIIAECTFLEVKELPTVYYDPATKKCDTSNAQNADDLPSRPDKYISPQEKALDGVKSKIETATSELDKLQGEVTKKIEEGLRTAGQAVSSGADSVINGIGSLTESIRG